MPWYASQLASTYPKQGWITYDTFPISMLIDVPLFQLYFHKLGDPQEKDTLIMKVCELSNFFPSELTFKDFHS